MGNNITDPESVWFMPAGGLSSDEDLKSAAKRTRPPKGIFAAFPGATPKYARNEHEEELDFRETMARMFLPITNMNYGDFVRSFKDDPNVQQIAAVLGGEVAEAGGTTGGSGYMDFLLQGVQHNFNEKMQVTEVLADDHVAYFFGQAAPTFAYNGILVNTKQDDQAANMYRLYKEFGRGSKLAERNTLISLRYDGYFVSGVMTNLNYTLSAETEMAIPFSFNLLVKQFTVTQNIYSSVVSLTQPFAADSQGYTPFDPGSLATGIVPTSPAMTPSATTKAAITPAATELTAAEKQKAEDQKGLDAHDALAVKVSYQTNVASIVMNPLGAAATNFYVSTSRVLGVLRK